MASAIKWDNQQSVLNAVRAWPAVFRDEITIALRISADLIVGQVKLKTPVGTGEGGGNLQASIQPEARPMATPYGWVMYYGSASPYVKPIEYGRKPGSRPPPLAPIARWVWLHRQYFDSLADATGEDDPQVLLLASRIARNIGLHGFKSAPDGPGKGWGMFAKGIKAATPDVRHVFSLCRQRITARCNAGA
jgi:hypothetical protein